MTTSEFDAAMELTPTADEETVEAMLTREWAVGPAVNGGVLMALAASALRRRLGSGGHEDPVALSAYFLSAGAPGPATVTTQVLRVGRTLSSGQASITQGVGETVVERMRALASFGDLSTSTAAERSTPPPDLPDPDDCLSAAQAPPQVLGGIHIVDRLDLRIDPDTAGWALGNPSGRGWMRGWIRLADGRDADPISLLFLLDAMPPVAFDIGAVGWTPTLEFNAHVRARPAPGWLRMSLRTENLAGGLLEEDAHVWDSTGRLVAQSRQLCAVRMPEDAPLGEVDDEPGSETDTAADAGIDAETDTDAP